MLNDIHLCQTRDLHFSYEHKCLVFVSSVFVGVSISEVRCHHEGSVNENSHCLTLLAVDEEETHLKLNHSQPSC